MVDESIEEMVQRACRGEQVASLPFEPRLPHKEDQTFALDLENFTFVNHGAFGAAVRPGIIRAQDWREFAEEQPLRFFDRKLFPGLVESVRRLSHFIGASPAQITLTNNATAGLDSIISSLFDPQSIKSCTPGKLSRSGKPRDHIIVFDTTYGSVKKMASRFTNGMVHEFKLPIPVSACSSDEADAFVCAAVEDQLKSVDLESVGLVVLDHVTSNTALQLPIEEMGAIFQKHGIPVLVDGAHGPWATDLDLEKLSCDFYVGNCHKWLCSPKSVGFAFVREPGSYTGNLFPRITSHGFDSGYPGSFLWDGCRDYSAALALPAVLDFWEQEGIPEARSTAISLVKEAKDLLESRWNTQSMSLAPRGSNLLNLPMTCVGLPEHAGSSSTDAHSLQEFLYHVHRVECPVKAINGRLYLRLSAHIYNTLEHFQRVADAVDVALEEKACV